MRVVLFCLTLIFLSSCSIENTQGNSITKEKEFIITAEAEPVINRNAEVVSIDNNLEDAETIVKIEKVTTSASLVAVGDVLIHSSVYRDALLQDGSYDFKPMFARVKKYISSADIAIANQETMIGGAQIGLSDYPLFNSPFEIGDALKDTGFNMVTIANNHTLDTYYKTNGQSIKNALNHWDKIGMLYTGSFKSPADRDSIRTLTTNDITFSVLSYSYGTNGLPVPENKDYLINLIDLDSIRHDVIKAKEVSDVIVASIHWGNEYEQKPNNSQIELAQTLSEMGVDIIVGHHPHVLQPFEWLENADGHKTLVMYSLGNFISAQDRLPRLIGGIGGVEVIKTVEGGKVAIELIKPSLLLTYGYYKNWRNYEVIPMTQLDDSLLTDWLEHYEETKNHMSQSIPELIFPTIEYSP
jgi:poly-gamma-glutamate capsule biosynthesis protein CapA/YwtB (metallophosphatase superfamily)